MELVIKQSIDRASQSLSKIIRTGTMIEVEHIEVINVSQWTEQIMDKGEIEMLGSMLSLEGDFSSKFLFLIKVKDAFILNDLMIRNSPGTTTSLDYFTKSTIQEIGNVLCGSIANTFSKDFNISMWPSVPLLLDDYLGSIFSNFITEGAAADNIIWLIETKFLVVKVHIECELYLILNTENFARLQKLLNKEGK